MKLPPRVTKLPADLVEMLGTIAHHEDTSIAEVADTLIRRTIQARFEKLPKDFRDHALARIARLTGEPTASAK